jgi:molecular chaperone GrpE
MTDKRKTTDDGKRKPRARAAEPAPQAEEAEVLAGQETVSGELDTLATQCDEYLDHLRRLQAEFDNYRKRVQRDSEQHRLRAAEVVVESLLPVMDNMSRALEAAAQHEEGQLIAGLELVAGQLRATLEGHGLEEVPVETGTLFDPNIHEAVMTQASQDYEEGTVLQVLERGYLLHGRLLRPAKVIVTS